MTAAAAPVAESPAATGAGIDLLLCFSKHSHVYIAKISSSCNTLESGDEEACLGKGQGSCGRNLQKAGIWAGDGWEPAIRLFPGPKPPKRAPEGNLTNHAYQNPLGVGPPIRQLFVQQKPSPMTFFLLSCALPLLVVV